VRLVTFALMLAALAANPLAVQASLLGASVDVSLTFFPDGGTTNFYDPANGFVPGGVLNAGGTTVTISTVDIEYGFSSSAAEIFSNFTDSHLFGNRGGNPFHPTCKIGHLDKEPGLT